MEENKDIIVETDEIQANSSNPEPLARSVYTMKAFQSSYQPATLAWDSVGDKANYNTNEAVTSEKWVRQGIYICSSDQLGGPGFFITDYDGFYDLPTYGNLFFKAVMCRIDLKVMVPPYSNFLAVVDVERTVFKEGDGNSSTWVGMASGEWDACNTISENNCGASGEWVGAPIESGFYSYMGRSCHIDEMRPCVYKTWSIDNRFSEKVVRTSMTPKYLMNMLERPEKYNTRMGYVDKYHISTKEFSLHFTAYVWYGGDFNAGSYSENKATRLVLRTSERTGYIMKGWLDADINMLYPAGGAYRQRRGAKLQEQWIEDVVPYTVAHYHADGKGNYSYSSETFYYMAGGLVCPQPDQNAAYKTPEPITACVAGDGSTVIAYYYEIAKYPVQYSANGGEFEDGTDYVESSLSYGEKIPENNLLAYRQGYTFEKWEPQLPQKMPCNAVTTRIVWAANNYTVKYDKNDANATGEMEPQGFVYDQPQQLCKNEYKCKHTVSFAVGERRGDNAYFKPQTAECHFMGWAEKAAGEKAYDDGATVCNLTSERDGEKTLYAVWKSAGILLPQLQIYHDGFYFDAWYLDENFDEKAGEPGSMYIPTKSETLYGKVVCTGVKNTRWVQGEEPVDERTIAAEWDEMKEATAYRVGLESAQEGEDKKNYPFLEEDFMGDDIKLTEDGMAEVKGCRLDLIKALKRFTAGGSFKFSVVPIIPNFPQENIRRTVSPAITTLARPNDEDLKWDGIKAVWKKIEGAEYYLIWMIDEQGEDITEQGIEYSSYGLLTGGAGDKAIQVEAGVGPEESAEIGNVADDNGCIVKFELLAYSDTCYTPPYVMPESDYRR